MRAAPVAGAAALVIAVAPWALAHPTPDSAAPRTPLTSAAPKTPQPSVVGPVGPAGVAHTEGPPPGYTGGFGEPSCVACHAEFDLNVGGSLTLEGLPSTYEPGATYVVSVILRSTDMARAGFQATARYDDGTGGSPEGRLAGSLASLDARTAVVADSSRTMRYVQHVAGSAETPDPELASWSFQWTAPARAEGDVLFHAAANSANGDNSPLGDLVYTIERRLEQPSPDPTSPRQLR